MSRRISHLLLIGLILIGAAASAQFDSANTYDPQTVTGVRTFERVYQIVKDNYAEPIDDDKAIYGGAIPGMLRVLDPHSNFFDPQDYALLERQESGERYGLGLSLASEGSRVVVASTVADAPAHRAGIRPGDTVIAVNGRPAAGLKAAAVAEMLDAGERTEVRLTVKRDGSRTLLTFVVLPKRLKVHSVHAFVIPPGIGYLEISEFDETTGREVKHALHQLGNVDGLILDLRQNPGGLLQVATGVADQFLPKGALIGTLVGRSSPKEVYRVQYGEKGRKFPMVVLVDEGTASAAEFIAGALQDQDRALIVGQKTFGKSVAQTLFPLSDHTGLALTTARLYLPSGRFIQRPYRGISVIDYFYGSHVSTRIRQVSFTRTGRPVYGGSGINPDVVLPAYKRNRFEDRLLSQNAVFGFSTIYAAHHRISKHFEFSNDMLQDFCSYLVQRHIPFTAEELRGSREWLRREIQAEIFAAAFGSDDGLQVRAENDPKVLWAIRLLPAARQLAGADN
jgi:carboxyl-terminal processing protease